MSLRMWIVIFIIVKVVTLTSLFVTQQCKFYMMRTNGRVKKWIVQIYSQLKPLFEMRSQIKSKRTKKSWSHQMNDNILWIKSAQKSALIILLLCAVRFKSSQHELFDRKLVVSHFELVQFLMNWRVFRSVAFTTGDIPIQLNQL